MCEFLSFVVCKDGRLLANNLNAHEGIEALHKLKPDTYRECEWVDEGPDSLTVRVAEGETKGQWLAPVLARFPHRIDLLNWFLANPKTWVNGWLYLNGLTSAEREAISAKGYKVY